MQRFGWLWCCGVVTLGSCDWSAHFFFSCENMVRSPNDIIFAARATEMET
jgi:hypothetical protein